MKKIFLIFGTRPEAIKVAPVILELKRAGRFKTVICVTAQHRELLDQVLEIFNIRVDYDLNVMQDNQSLFHITSAVLTRLEKILEKEKPDLVLVHGDTTTTFAGALSSYYKKIPVGHIEAGLRTYDKFNPFPEEVNRLLADAICELYFAPTAGSRDALLKENIPAGKIFVTGNTVIDALFASLGKKHSFGDSKLRQLFNDKNKLINRRIILVTAHRRENFGPPLLNICRALKAIAGRYPDTAIIYPVHPNPNVRKTVHGVLSGVERVVLLEPLDYLDLINVMRKSYLVVTDSGGLQEEAPSLGKPVLVLRKATERPEGVKAGTVKVIGLDKKQIIKHIAALLDNKTIYGKMSSAVNPYGDGKASKRIVEAIEYFFGISSRKPSVFNP